MTNLVQSQAISVFNFKSTPVRTQLVDNNIWFCLIDVCDSLALKRKSNVLDRLDEDGSRKTWVIDSMGRKQETTFINEPNLYRLIFRSNKPAALQFAKWVYEEVLPTIRKTGSYSVDKSVIVSEHTRSLPAGKKEIVLSEKAREEIGGIVKAVVTKALEERPSTVMKINGEVISVPDSVYKGIHTGLMALDPIMNNLHRLIEGACKKAIDDLFKMDIKNDNIFSLYKFVKSACRRAMREEVSKLLPSSSKTEYWEVSDNDLLFHLYRWHNTRNKEDTLNFRKLHAQCDTLVAENTDLKNRLQQISAWVK